MSADRRPLPALHYIWGRRGGKTQILNEAIKVMLDNGRHVHIADMDGDWCLLDGECT